MRGKPVVVGWHPNSRGVVATCSYEARKYGMHSAMPSKIAYKRCPYATFVKPRFDVYKQVSNQIRDIFCIYTDLVEPLSLDEAFLDVTNSKIPIKYATIIAKFIKRDILLETGLNSSAGVSYNKFWGIGKVTSKTLKNIGIKNGYDLLKNIEDNNLQVRLLGVTLSNLVDEDEIYHPITFLEYISSK